MNPLRGAFASLKFKLAMASLLVIAVCVTATSTVVLGRVYERSARAVMDLEAGNAERMASLLARRVVGLQTALAAAGAGVATFPLDDPAAVQAQLERQPVLLTLFSVVAAARADGEVVAWRDARGTRNPGINVADRAYFRKTLAERRPIVSEPVMGRASNEPIIVLTVPISGADGRVAVVMLGTLRLGSRSLLDDLAQSSEVAQDPVTTIVVDQQGRIIAHPQAERVMQDVESETALRPALQRWVQQGRPIEPTADVLHAKGWFVASAGVPGADWMVFRVAADDVLLGGVISARDDSLALAGGVALGGALLLLALLTWLLRPLRQLQRRAHALGEGSATLDEGWPGGHDEIGELSAVLQQVLRERLRSDAAKAELLGKMDSVLAAAPIGIAFSRAQKFELVSAQFAQLLGYSADALVSRPAREIFASKDEYEQLGPRVGEAFGDGRPFVDEMQFLRADGGLFWGRLQGRPVEAGNADAGTIWLLEDVTEQRLKRERLSWAASHDALTRLYNREAFTERVAEWMAQQPRQVPAALLYIDLDHFKQVNDSAGHAAGDDVLKAVAALLQASTRGTDTVARLGGDEFAVLLPQCDAAAALPIAEQVRAGARGIGVTHEGRRLTIGASIGVVEIEAHMRDVADALATADAACYAAKRAGRDAVHFGGAAATPVALRLVAGGAAAHEFGR